MKRNLLAVLCSFIISITSVFGADCEHADFSFTINEYLHIESITSPVLTANITDRTGNLYAPLSSKFRVNTNCTDAKKLYLKAIANTNGGVEEAMFDLGGRIYIAFTNTLKVPSVQSLVNCKMGGNPKSSPGVVAYPVTSVVGAESKYLSGQGKYEIIVKNGITNITANIGSNVLKSSFASNDPNGFYQATLVLTESDI